MRDELDAASGTNERRHDVFVDLGSSAGSPLSGALLHLHQNYKLVSRDFVIEEVARNGKVLKKRSFIDDCHYHGVIRNHGGFSKVALSLCNGLVSI